MIPIKTPSEVKIMKTGGQLLASIMFQILKKVGPGVELQRLDQLADQLIEKAGGSPSFKKVRDYRWATCLNVNQGVVHGVPTKRRLKLGDLLSVDVGMRYQGFHSDMARTIKVKGKNEKGKNGKEAFLEAGEKALDQAIKAAKPGNRIGHISKAIERGIQRAGYQPIKALTGHGIGVKLHESPPIPCLLRTKIGETPKILPGMTFAIEVIYSQGEPKIEVGKDGWTIETVDQLPAALFENTVAITSHGSEVLTQT